MRRNKNTNRAAVMAAVAAAAAMAVLGALAYVAGDSAAQNAAPEISLDSAATFPVDI